VKSRLEGHCHLCDKAWYKGSEIAMLLGSWVHGGCKSQELARRLSEGRTTTLPSDPGAVGSKQVTRPTLSQRRKAGGRYIKLS
jgi:hypothetical protein